MDYVPFDQRVPSTEYRSVLARILGCAPSSLGALLGHRRWLAAADLQRAHAEAAPAESFHRWREGA